MRDKFLQLATKTVHPTFGFDDERVPSEDATEIAWRVIAG